MLDFGFYNMDCMEGMKEFPDGYFDLAIVDPPYGDAGGEFNGKDGSRFGGRFDKYTDGGVLQTRRTLRKVECNGQAEHGRRSLEKNCGVGHFPKTGIL